MISELISKLESVVQDCDDLRLPPWRGSKNPLAGHCYIVSEIFYYILGGKSAGWKPMFVRVKNTPHWFLQHENGTILDPTESQFDCSIPRELARGKGFLTKELSKRARVLLDRLGLEYAKP